MRNSMIFGSLAAILLAASGCEQPGKVNPTAGGGGLAGNWTPDSGGYTAEFQSGNFRTTATDTGNVISQGSYVALSESEVELNWSSNVTGLENRAKCSRPSADVLNCTDDGGKSFTLRRIST